MIRRPPRSTQSRSSAASDVYKRQGFWYEKDSAATAGKKAFIVNRIGDFGFLLGIFLLFVSLGAEGVWTLNFGEIQKSAHLLNGNVVTMITLLFFVGAVGKSAQI